MLLIASSLSSWASLKPKSFSIQDFKGFIHYRPGCLTFIFMRNPISSHVTTIKSGLHPPWLPSEVYLVHLWTRIWKYWCKQCRYVKRISGANIWYQQTKSNWCDSFRLLLATSNVLKVSQCNKNLPLYIYERELMLFVVVTGTVWALWWLWDVIQGFFVPLCVSTNHWGGAKTDEAQLCDLIYDWLLQVL